VSGDWSPSTLSFLLAILARGVVDIMIVSAGLAGISKWPKVLRCTYSARGKGCLDSEIHLGVEEGCSPKT
jgi:hypothetical protein